MVTTAAQVATGKPFAEAQRDLDAGIRHLARLKENGAIAYTGAPQANQDAAIGPGATGALLRHLHQPDHRAGRAHQAGRAALGHHGEIVGLNMPVNVKNVELAERYVNMSLSREFQSKIDSVLHARSRQQVDPSPRTIELLGPADNILYADWRFLSEQRARLTDAWNNVFG